MCQLCAQTRTFDPARHADAATAFAEISEGSDAAASSSTLYDLSLGDSFIGALDYEGDRDWVRVTLTAGDTYEVALTGDTLLDPYLRLYDASGTLVAENDDNGSLNSGLSYEALNSGTYYIVAGAFSDEGTGSYQISFDLEETDLPTDGREGTLDEMADYLTSGYWGTAPRAYDTRLSNQITVDITDLSANEQQLARWAFEAWERVADLDFVEVKSGASMVFGNRDSGAYATFSSMGNYITSSEVNVSADWAKDYGTTISSYTFSTYVHEIGHALGLGHQGDYNGNATYGRDETFTNDSYQLSVMSYFSQEDNPTVDADYAEPITAMMTDIIAIQNLYGAPGSNSQTAGNTVWGENTNLSGYLADVLNSLDGSYSPTLGEENVAFTIYDDSGTDLINLATSRADNHLDMNDTGISNIGGLTGNMMIARGTVIENAKLGSGDDTVIGNEANNKIWGRNGDDDLSGHEGRDLLIGGGGRDTLSGGAGNDKLNGGGSNDVLTGDAGNDLLKGGGGVDALTGGAGDDVLIGGRSADTFIFAQSCGNDTIRDFTLGVDNLVLDTALTGGLSTGAEVWDSFGSLQNGQVCLDFGAGDVITLSKVTDGSALIDDILFV